jgi:hypothetical protein
MRTLQHLTTIAHVRPEEGFHPRLSRALPDHARAEPFTPRRFNLPNLCSIILSQSHEQKQ